MGWLKKIGIGLLALIVLGMIFGGNSDKSKSASQSNDIVANTESQSAGSQQSSSQSQTVKSSALAIKNPAEMLPIRADLSTEWKLGQITNKTVNAVGFSSGASTQPLKTGSSPTSVQTDIYKFDTVANADDYYQTTVSTIKQAGGYKEISSSNVDAKCYAYEMTSTNGISTMSFIYCVKNNVVFYLRAVQQVGLTTSDDMLELAKTIPAKIN